MATFLLGMPTSGKSTWARSFSSRVLEMDFGSAHDSKSVLKVRNCVRQMIQSSVFDMVDIVDSHVCYFDQSIIQMLLEQGHDVLLSVGDFTGHPYPTIQDMKNALLNRIKERDGEGRFYSEAKEHAIEWIKNTYTLFWRLVRNNSTWHPSSRLFLVRNFLVTGDSSTNDGVQFYNDRYMHMGDDYEEGITPLNFGDVSLSCLLAKRRNLIKAVSCFGEMDDIKEDKKYV